MGIKILDYRPYSKNTLQGFLDILLPSGMEVREMTYHKKGDKRWVGYPARPYEDAEGKIQYSNIVYFPDKDRHRQFQEAVVTAFDEFVPTEPKKESAAIPF